MPKRLEATEKTRLEGEVARQRADNAALPTPDPVVDALLLISELLIRLERT